MSRAVRQLLSELSFFLLLGAFAMACGWQWLLASLLAALVHEAGHLLVLRAFGGGGGRFCVDAAGFRWERSGKLLSYGQEILALLAGPLANMLFAFLLAFFAGETGWQAGFFLAGTQLVLGVFNLLPVLPLDGAQVLELLFSWLTDPLFAARLTETVGLLTLGMLLASAVWLLALTSACFPLVSVLALLTVSLQEMGLVKGAGKE